MGLVASQLVLFSQTRDQICFSCSGRQTLPVSHQGSTQAGCEARLALVLCLPPGVDDTVTVILQYPGGVHGSFTCSISAQLANTVSVSGTKGMAQVRHDWLSWDGSKYWEPGPLARGIGQSWLLELDGD